MSSGPGAANVGSGRVAQLTGQPRATPSSHVAWLRWDGAMTMRVPRLELLLSALRGQLAYRDQPGRKASSLCELICASTHLRDRPHIRTLRFRGVFSAVGAS